MSLFKVFTSPVQMAFSVLIATCSSFLGFGHRVQTAYGFGRQLHRASDSSSWHRRLGRQEFVGAGCLRGKLQSAAELSPARALAVLFALAPLSALRLPPGRTVRRRMLGPSAGLQRLSTRCRFVMFSDSESLRESSTSQRNLDHTQLKVKALPLKGDDTKSAFDQIWSAFGVGFSKSSEKLDEWYEESFKIKCPFFRRRAFDTIESLKRTLVWIVARHKSIPFFPNPRAAHPIVKSRGLPVSDIAAIIQADWSGRGSKFFGKGYYITGKLTTEIYDEDCFFDGPDPDMPVKGLRKYLFSASQLFDRRRSRADLLRPVEYSASTSTVVAHWRLEGVLNLPWHPEVKPWTGSTTYEIDTATGLIVNHREHWDITVPDAFVSTLLPQLNYGARRAEPVGDLVHGPPQSLD